VAEWLLVAEAELGEGRRDERGEGDFLFLYELVMFLHLTSTLSYILIS
jgi:hypothetical protein